MGGQDEVKRRIHSLSYIEQMMSWGFDKEFIARDMGVTLSSLETRLRRAKVRETNGNQGIESGAGSGDDDRAGSQEG